MSNQPKYIEFLGTTEEEMDANEYIPAHVIRKKLKLSPIQFVGMLNGNTQHRLVTEREEWFQYVDSYGTSNDFTQSMLDELKVHYLDLERYLQVIFAKQENVPEQQVRTEQSSDNESIGQEETSGTKGRNTVNATIKKLQINLISWQDAVPLFVQATIACLEAKKKKRSRTELERLCGLSGIKFPVKGQFEAWRNALPSEYVDRKNRGKASQNNDSHLATEEDFQPEI